MENEFGIRRMTDFQIVIRDIENYEFTENEKEWAKEYIGETLTEKQKADMYQRFHLHLAPEEKGEGFKTTKENKRNTSKDLLPKSLMPLLEPIVNDKADLKKKWSLFSKFLWWSKFVRHIKVDENMWDIGEKLLALYPNGRKAIMIDVRESIKHRTIIEN